MQQARNNSNSILLRRFLSKKLAIFPFTSKYFQEQRAIVSSCLIKHSCSFNIDSFCQSIFSISNSYFCMIFNSLSLFFLSCSKSFKMRQSYFPFNALLVFLLVTSIFFVNLEIISWSRIICLFLSSLFSLQTCIEILLDSALLGIDRTTKTAIAKTVRTLTGNVSKRKEKTARKQLKYVQVFRTTWLERRIASQIQVSIVIIIQTIESVLHDH